MKNLDNFVALTIEAVQKGNHEQVMANIYCLQALITPKLERAELKVLIGSLEASAKQYEDAGSTMKQDIRKHFVYLKQRALITKLTKALIELK